MLDNRTIKIVADEIALASDVGANISGEQIADLHNLDRNEVADAIRSLLKVGAIRLTGKRKAKPLGTPISQLSTRPGEPGYAEWLRISRSWGYD